MYRNKKASGVLVFCDVWSEVDGDYEWCGLAACEYENNYEKC
jgi:hypothetical protein